MNLEEMNITELSAIIRQRTGVIIKRSVPRERLAEIIVQGVVPPYEEWAETMETRKRLQVFIEKSWDWVNSQLPCKGPDRGKCTIYPCPEGRHVDCYTSNREHLQLHGVSRDS